MVATGHVTGPLPDGQRQEEGLRAYERRRLDFSWDEARAALDGQPGGGLNIAHEAVDRHAGATPTVTAIRAVARDGQVQDISYAELRERTDRFAAVLDGLGVEPGERVFSLLGRGPDVYVTVLGTLKHRSVLCPLFAAFGPEPVRQRLQLGRGRVLVTTQRLYRSRVLPVRHELPDLAHVLLVDAGPEVDDPATGTWSLPGLLDRAPDGWVTPRTDPQDPALLHFTSGTTGTPKGAVHVHEAVVAHHATAGLVLDLRPGDVFWCTADPGWVTGTSYGIVAPLTHGVTVVTDAGELEARRWYGLLAEQQVDVWYTAPTALRMLMRSGADLPGTFDLSRLRHVASVGEPLNPQVVEWGREALGLTVHDGWWQSETGAIMVSNLPGVPVRPGSMGLPLPGIDVTVLRRDEDGLTVDGDGHVEPVRRGEVGELAVRAGWPSMFRAYLDQPERYARCFADGWYLSGDVARQDEDGYVWFVGRGDDVIKSAGHLIGPFEVESALMEHEAVAEAAVVGLPDDVAGDVVTAYVSLRQGWSPEPSLADDILAFGRRRLGSAMAPRAVHFDDHLPHTRSGKVLRRLLRARALGLPEGDLSTLEPS